MSFLGRYSWNLVLSGDVYWLGRTTQQGMVLAHDGLVTHCPWSTQAHNYYHHQEASGLLLLTLGTHRATCMEGGRLMELKPLFPEIRANTLSLHTGKGYKYSDQWAPRLGTPWGSANWVELIMLVGWTFRCIFFSPYCKLIMDTISPTHDFYLAAVTPLSSNSRV